MDSAMMKGDFDSLLFLHKHRSEGCSLKAAEGAYANDHKQIFEWLRKTYPGVVKLDVFREQFRAPPSFVSPLLDRVGHECQYYN